MDGLSERELEQLIRLLRKLRFSAGDFEAEGTRKRRPIGRRCR